MQGLSPLFIASTIRSFAFSMLGIFIPLYIYKLFEAQPIFATGELIIFGVLAYFAIYHLFVLIFNYFAVFLVKRIHFRGSMLLGDILVVIRFLFLILAQKNLWFLIPSAIFGGIAVPFYWNSYHAIFIEDGRQKRLGRDLSTQGVLSQLAGILGPALGGIIITSFGFTPVYILALILICFASLPVFLMPHHPQFQLPSLKVMLKNFFSKKFRKDVLALTAVGGEGCVNGVFWPIFVFAIIGSYKVMGIISSAVGIISLLALLLAGKLVDKKSKESILKFGSAAYSLIWVARIFVKTVSQVFLIDSAGTVLTNFWILPFDVLVFKKAEDGVLINYLILREWAIHFGHFLIIILMMVLMVLNFDYVIGFVVAAIFTLLSGLIAV